MRKNQKLIVPIRQVLNVIVIAILVSTSIFIYNTSEMNNVELAKSIEKVNKDKEKIVEVARIEKSETSRTAIERTKSSEQSRSAMNQRTKVTTYENKIDNQIQEQIEVTAIPIETYVSISEVKISRNMDVTARTNLSKQDFKTLISTVKQDTSKFFYNNADIIYDLCKKYELNEIFFCGLISAESGWDIAGNHRRTCNYISLMSGGKLLQFSSVESGLEAAAKALHKNYLTPGGSFYFGKTLTAVKTRFCPASSTWVDLVYGRMQQII